MSDGNIAEFTLMVARALGLLYRAHPVAVDLHTKEMIAGAGQQWTDQQEGVAFGTLLWLTRNGIVDGELVDGSSTSWIKGAQLAASTVHLLEQIEPSGGKTLGAVATSILSQPDDMERARRADLVLLWLTGG